MLTVVSSLHKNSVLYHLQPVSFFGIGYPLDLLDGCSGPCWMDWIYPHIQSIQSINITEHNSARCRCKVLHAFNMRRAEQISLSLSQSDSSSS